ncbi:hypothetical protein B0H12DRAFT_1127027, partial [Mycena haematopus]
MRPIRELRSAVGGSDIMKGTRCSLDSLRPADTRRFCDVWSWVRDRSILFDTELQKD